jgi:hypothetical protein
MPIHPFFEINPRGEAARKSSLPSLPTNAVIVSTAAHMPASDKTILLYRELLLKTWAFGGSEVSCTSLVFEKPVSLSSPLLLKPVSYSFTFCPKPVSYSFTVYEIR